MTLREWMIDHEIDPERALCMSVATDGFQASKHNIMALSFAGRHLPKATESPVTYYIEGAEVSKDGLVDVTGVSPAYYHQRSVGMKRALELFESYVLDSSCLITYALSGFLRGRGWLDKCPDCINHLPALDVVNVFKMYDDRGMLPVDLDTVTGLNDRLEAAYRHKKGRWGIETLFQDNLPDRRTKLDNKSEQRIHDLWALWNIALDRRTA